MQLRTKLSNLVQPEKTGKLGYTVKGAIHLSHYKTLIIPLTIPPYPG